MSRSSLLVLTVLALVSRPAAAATIFFDDFAPQQPGWSFVSPSADFLGQLNNNLNVASVTLTLTAPDASPGVVQFDLLGFRSIDHFNCCTDILTFSVNSSVMFTGAWSGDLAGAYGFSSNAAGASFSFVGYTADGDVWRFIVPISLLAGSNTFTWAYSPLQSFADEAWGLDNVQVDAVPEPATLALVGLGLAVAGRLVRRRG